MAISGKVRVSNLLPKFLANALIFLGSLQSARAVSTCAFQTLFDGLDHFFIFVKSNCHNATSLLGDTISYMNHNWKRNQGIKNYPLRFQKRWCILSKSWRCDGERCERCQWQEERTERVAAVDSRGRRSVADDDVGHRNRHNAPNTQKSITPAGVMELVDVVDSKSTAGDSVPVRVRSPAPKRTSKSFDLLFLFVFVSARTQHHLTACGQHHFVLCTNIIPL